MLAFDSESYVVIIDRPRKTTPAAQACLRAASYLLSSLLL